MQQSHGLFAIAKLLVMYPTGGVNFFVACFASELFPHFQIGGLLVHTVTIASLLKDIQNANNLSGPAFWTEHPIPHYDLMRPWSPLTATWPSTPEKMY